MSMPEINVCPGTLAEGFSSYSPTALRLLFERKKVSHILPFPSPTVSEESAERFRENRKRISISGVQEKLSLVLEKNQLRLTSPGEHGAYILKPIPADVRLASQAPANEHLTMQIARQVYNIETAENALIFFDNGEPAYITRRFDVKANGSRGGKEDFASLAGKTSENAGPNFKYDSSYEEIGLLIRKFIPAWRVEIERYFATVVFNFLFMNGDAHLKNFSILETEDGDYRLAPAYDLMNTNLHVSDDEFPFKRGLFTDDYKSDKYKSSLHPAREDFREFGRRIGVNQARLDVILAAFLERQDTVRALIDRSYLNTETKNLYLRNFRTRRNYLSR